MLSFQSVIDHFSDAPVGLNSHYVVVDKSILERINKPLPARFVVKVNDQQWHGAVMSMGNGNGFILLNKSVLRKLKLGRGDSVSVVLEPETSEYGMPMCDELAEVLKQDPEADDRFHALTPGKQRNIIYFIGKIKSSQLRIDKSIFLLNNLKNLPRGKENVGKIFGAR